MQKIHSPPSRPLGGMGRVGLHASTPDLTRTGTLAQSARTEGVAVSEQAPSLHHAADKTRPPSGDNRYGKPPSKYGPTGTDGASLPDPPDDVSEDRRRNPVQDDVGGGANPSDGEGR